MELIFERFSRLLSSNAQSEPIPPSNEHGWSRGDIFRVEHGFVYLKKHMPSQALLSWAREIADMGRAQEIRFWYEGECTGNPHVEFIEIWMHESIYVQERGLHPWEMRDLPR